MSTRPFDYILKVTGDCQNIGQGAVYIEPIGGVPPYDINWVYPSFPIASAVTSTTKTGLSVGYYQMLVTDASTTNDNELYFLFTIGESYCVNISSEGTTCGLNNGIIGVTAQTTTNNVNYYLYNLINELILSANTTVGYNTFFNLSPGMYYVYTEDEGGCTAKTQVCSIKPSVDFDFDFYIVDDSQCFNATGRIFVINQNSTGPYTYQWSNGETTQSISGLTAGQYSVTVTDVFGCSKTKIATVNIAPPLTFSVVDPSSPTCESNNDGQISAYLTGGILPVKYLLSNGDSQVLWDRVVTFNNLSVGTYILTAIDAGKCTATTQVTLTSVDSFNILNVKVTPSTCNSNNGSVVIDIQGGAVPYVAILYDVNNGSSYSQTTSASQVILNNIPTGIYQLSVSNPSACNYTQPVIVYNEDKFTLSATTQDTSCGENNGYITLTISSGGTAPYVYQVGNQIKTSTLLTQSFFNLSSGIYTVSVTDDDQCTQSTSVPIKSSNPVEFTMIETGCLYGNDATITLLISSGEPPFTIDWSPNVGAQSGIYVTGLTEGEYFAVVSDDNGCKVKKTVKIVCGKPKSAFRTFTLCEDVFKQTTNSIFGISQIYAQGFQDLTAGSACTLNFSIFEIEVIVGSTSGTYNLGTFYSLNEYPTDQEIADAIENLLESINGIGSVVIDIDSNTISINTDCERTISADTVTINLNILYDFCCIVTTTTTCGDCRKYSVGTLDGTPIEVAYTPCDNTAPRYNGLFKYTEFCSKISPFYPPGNNIVAQDLGCCNCNNSPLPFYFDEKDSSCPVIQQQFVAQVAYVSGNTLPLNLDDKLYLDICLTTPAPTGYYRDQYSSLIYYYDINLGVYKIVNC